MSVRAEMFVRLTAPEETTVVVVLTYPDFVVSLTDVAVTFTRNVPGTVFVTFRLNIRLAPAFRDTGEVMFKPAVEAPSGSEITRS